MSDLDVRTKLGLVVISPYQIRWQDEFAQLAGQIRTLVGAAATRIDHIGSTAVPGLSAKDVIDIQITVDDLEQADVVTFPLQAANFRQGVDFIYDEFHTKAATDPELRKLYMREPKGERRAHIHIRELGRFNQQYALLFRDYLRASKSIRSEYELVKQRAAQIFPDNIDGYLLLKDPVFHIIYEAATLWASNMGWTPDNDYR